MDDEAIGLVAWIFIGVGGLIGALALTGGVLYANDYGLEATVVGGTCASYNPTGVLTSPPAERTITVQTKMFGIEYTMTEVPTEQCAAIGKDNFVKYHLKSERTSLWEKEGGTCLYDSEYGPGGCDK